jgi:hypothetical protein
VTVVLPDPFAPSQIVGYAAFILGIVAFSQKDDRRLKLMNAAQTLVYGMHFLLLGQPVAAGSAFIGTVRSAVAARRRPAAAWLLWLFIAVNLGVGALGAQAPIDWLPVLGWCLGTIAVLRLRGIPMRLTLIAASAVVLVANLGVGSIGGTVLEICIATANAVTIVRMLRTQRAAV